MVCELTLVTQSQIHPNSLIMPMMPLKNYHIKLSEMILTQSYCWFYHLISSPTYPTNSENSINPVKKSADISPGWWLSPTPLKNDGVKVSWDEKNPNNSCSKPPTRATLSHHVIGEWDYRYYSRKGHQLIINPTINPTILDLLNQLS